MSHRPTNQPTNQQPTLSAPCTYVSMRVTIAHNRWSEVENLLKDCEWYISYPHVGKNKDNEHFHIFVGAKVRADCEKYRKRFKSLSLSGNKCICVKLYENTIYKGIQYASREGTEPIVKGDVHSWISEAPPWLDHRKISGSKRKVPDDELGIKLTVSNVLYKAWNYKQEKGLHSDDLLTVTCHMLSNGYYLCPQFAKGAAPDFYISVFKDSCQAGHLVWQPSTLVGQLFRNFNR